MRPSKAVEEGGKLMDAPEGEKEAVQELLCTLTEQELQRLTLLQGLIATAEQPGYGKRQQVVAQQLGITVRSVRRLVRQLRESGVTSVIRHSRSDRGEARISEEWQQFIKKTYREGNRGSRKMSPAQVAVRVRVRAEEIGTEEYPSHMTVYRILKPLQELGHRQKRSLGWRDDCLIVKTREGLEIGIEWSNQVWQVDHTQIDLLVVDMSGEILGRPWLTIVVDTYSRCMMGMHIGFDAPSAAVVCLALRHAILPKQYSSAYELKQSWGTYGLPRYLYTDGGKDFRSQHLEQVATELGIVLCRRRKPSDGGIVERPFGTFNREFFCTVPGYTGSNVKERSDKAESEACVTLVQLEQMLVRYIVDHYNQALDARMAEQSRIGRWEAGRMAQLPLLGERELDICLMRRDRRVVYRSGYIQFANLTYQGEHLAAYAGESVIIRYNPRDITTIYIYQLVDSKEVFLTRAHAMGWETEILSYREAQAISQRRREAGKAIDNRSLLEEVRSRQEQIKRLQRQKKQKMTPIPAAMVEQPDSIKAKEMLSAASSQLASTTEEPFTAKEAEESKQKLPVPFVRVYDYEQMKREAGLL